MKATWLGRFLIIVLSFGLPLAAADRLNDQEKEWLQMVDPIITSKERRTFRKKLNTHTERREFIKLFWARRDPDLDDDKNPFRAEYLARYDYAQTHFERTRRSLQSLDRSTVFMLLGMPDTKRNFVDWSLLGPGYRNPYFEYPPELWTYSEPGYDYKRKTLRIQFIPINTFGDYVAITDRITDFWLRDVKNKFIQHPELEEAPAVTVEEDDFQFLTAVNQRQKDDGTVRSRKKRGKQREDSAAPVTQTASTETRELGDASSADDPMADEPEPEGVTDLAVPSAPEQAQPLTRTDAPTTRGQAETVSMGATVEVEELTPPDLPETKKVEIEETDLNVPAPTVAPPDAEAVVFDATLGNELGLRSTTAYFKSGSDRNLVISRIGFPLSALSFSFQDNRYKAPFVIDYALVDSRGRRVAGDSIINDVAVPNRRIIDDPNRMFSQEFAAVLPGDRYTLKVHLKDQNSGKASYHQAVVEVPTPDKTNTRLSDLVLMDPDVNPEDARFSIKGTPYNLDLTARFTIGERLYPVVELLNAESLDHIEYIEIQARQGSEAVKTWDLYSEELTETNQRSMLLHPVLDTRGLKAGDYLLRFELELAGGELLLSETNFTLTND